MAYNSKTFGQSPFGNSAKTTAATPPRTRKAPPAASSVEEALSDQIEDDNAETDEESQPPVLPNSSLPASKSFRSRSIFYIPQGKMTGLDMLSEAVGWLMAWGTVGFFRAYLPAPVLACFDILFHPYCTAGITLLSALLAGQFLRRYQLKIASLRQLATVAIEYGEVRHRADAQAEIFELLSAAEAKTEQISRWLVSALTALGCLFIIGAFY
ncbi:MAG: hypothetical protein DCF25_20300 [Leptolyngbya foveolarum]|uniref:Uncharacterized protein n=1 Tax=Leptolyngbya foveolarum TaxID=47253 RepID=A0A2W4TUS1_9CYAN|nr:MAG: hypothetical protein DCF25_20300 [Leptolyngbya foveolarum]